MVYKFFDKFFNKFAAGSGVANNEIKEKLQLAEEFLGNNIWGADLADMELVTKLNKGLESLLCIIDIFSKCAWVVPLKNKKGISIVNAFQKILDKTGRKPNKIWFDKEVNFTIILLKNG